MPRKKHPAVAGGQESRSAVKPTRAFDEKPAAMEGGRQRGVSSLEPSFPRALRGPAARSDETRERVTRERKPEVLVSPPRQQQPPTPRFVGYADRGPGATPMADDTTPLPVEEINLALQARPLVNRDAAVRQRPQAPRRPLAPTDPVIHIDGLEREAGRDAEAFQRSPAPALSPLDETAWVAGIPRCCDTCREFHRDASGKRGYCGSPYAFGSRTMVQSDQLACRSSIGVWWLPSDDTWLDGADISHHTRPTPYLDAILAELRPESR